MTDDIYRKQLADFGIEQTQIVEGSAAKRRREDEEQTLLGITKALASSVAGRQWLYNQLTICQTFSPPFAPGKPDLSAFFAGTQAVGIRLFNEIMKVAPEKFYEMIVEADARKRGVKPKDSGTDEIIFT